MQKHQEGLSIGKKKDGTGNKEDAKDYGNEVKENIQAEERKVEEEVKERVISKNELRDKERENSSMQSQNQNTGRISHPGGNTMRTSSADPLQSESTADPVSSETAKQQNLNKNISQIPVYNTSNRQDPAKPGTSSCFLPAGLPEHTEQKRLLWMKECIPWSNLSCQNRKKQKGSVRSRTGPRRVAEGSSLPPLCPHTLLQSTGWRSLQEVTYCVLSCDPGTLMKMFCT